MDAPCLTSLQLSPALGVESSWPAPSPSPNRLAISPGSVKPASAPHLEEGKKEAPFEMETAHKVALLPAVSCTLLKAQVVFFPGLFVGAAT